MDIDQIGSEDEQFLVEQMEDDNEDITIGRPITLADVLVAIGNKQYEYGEIDFNMKTVSTGQEILIMSNFEKTVTWDLSKDFDHQSEAVWEFLHGLLCE